MSTQERLICVKPDAADIYRATADEDADFGWVSRVVGILENWAGCVFFATCDRDGHWTINDNIPNNWLLLHQSFVDVVG